MAPINNNMKWYQFAIILILLTGILFGNSLMNGMFYSNADGIRLETKVEYVEKHITIINKNIEDIKSILMERNE